MVNPETAAGRAIIALVCKERKVGLRDLLGPRRDRTYSEARCIAAGLCHTLVREWTGATIGRELGGRPRLFAARAVERLKRDAALRNEYARIKDLAVKLAEVQAL